MQFYVIDKIESFQRPVRYANHLILVGDKAFSKFVVFRQLIYLLLELISEHSFRDNHYCSYCCFALPRWHLFHDRFY